MTEEVGYGFNGVHYGLFANASVLTVSDLLLLRVFEALASFCSDGTSPSRCVGSDIIPQVTSLNWQGSAHFLPKTRDKSTRNIVVSEAVASSLVYVAF